MRKFIVLSIGNLLCWGVMAQTINITDSTAQYCAKLLDGLVIVTKDDRQIVQPVLLANGTQISTAGIVTKKGGGTLVMKEGDCVNKEGDLIEKKAAKK